MGERVHKSVLNAEVNIIFYFLTLFLAFFSRKIFLDCLGTEFIGLTGTLGNILGYLNLAELGITACIGYFLFKPLQTNNKQEIQDILSLLGYLYNWIGCIILAGGILISFFFPFIFSKAELGLGIIYFAYFSFLGSSLIGYFINYRQILLTADCIGQPARAFPASQAAAVCIPLLGLLRCGFAPKAGIRFLPQEPPSFY